MNDKTSTEYKESNLNYQILQDNSEDKDSIFW